MNWDEDLPEVSEWKPLSTKQDTLSDSLMISCQVAQRHIVARAEAEIRFNIQNFDSGLGLEDVLRDELSKLLPQRYSVDAGVVNDRSGNTADDCDILIRDHLWSSVVKPGATTQSRRCHFPIEGIYAAVEIKQTLGYKQLDDAMKKLVMLSRLSRPDNPYGHITENQHIPILDQPGHILNPLHTTVLATRLMDGVTFDEIAGRFGKINECLDRGEMVNMLCVLDYGTAWYSVASGNPYDADFMRDRDQTLILQVNERERESTFYRWYVLLLGHLTRSVLGLSSVSHSYGRPPPDRTVRYYPDAEFNKCAGQPD